jgi:sulfhydrogenase subunit beta (sulfur reductase)
LSARVVEKEHLDGLLAHFSGLHRVYAPVARKGHVSFQKVSGEDELRLDYVTTTLPPKKLFHRSETLIRYEADGDYSPPKPESDTPIMLFGVHPCDLNAILRQDKIFSEDFGDEYYLRRRANSVIVALNCANPGENCFCASLGTGPSVEEGFDLLLTDIGGKYLVEVGSPKGEEIMEKTAFDKANQHDLNKKAVSIEQASTKMMKEMRVEGLADLAIENPDHEVWTLIGEKGGLAGCFSCLSCGNCSLVCPTCYCFEVADIPDIDLKGGVRMREVDSCQLNEYALVALGHNFRPDRKIRTRHWMMCKFGAAAGGVNSSCVGCGRCIKACPAHIDLTEVAKSLRGE